MYDNLVKLMYESVGTAALNIPQYKESNLKLVFGSTKESITPVNGPTPPLPFAASEPFHTSIIAWRRLTTNNKHCKPVYEVTFDNKESNISFKVGDTIGVIPQNNKDDVDFLINHLNLTSVADLTYTLTTVDRGQKNSNIKIPNHIPIVSTIRHVLTHFVDLRAIVKKLFILALSRYTEDETERRALEFLSSKAGSEAYNVQILNKTCLLDILANIKSCKPPIEVLFQHLPTLLPRPYSIVNSPLSDPNVIKICFSVMDLGNNRKGLTTGWLEGIILKQNCSLEERFKNLNVNESTQIPIYLRNNSNGFGLPAKLDTPLILIGPGTGVSPYIGFLEEIECMKQKGLIKELPCIWLFFGCRHPDLDYIYQKELNNFVEKNVLNCLKTSFSRLNDNGIKYVQDAIIENGEDIAKLIKDGSKIFVCGDVKTMAAQVKDAIVDCLVRHDSRSAEEAEKCICDMQKNNTYIVDLWN